MLLLFLGLTLTEKWNTDNTLGTVFEIKDQFAKGLKVTLDTSYVPHNAKRGCLLKTEWTGKFLKVCIITVLKFLKKILHLKYKKRFFKLLMFY